MLLNCRGLSNLAKLSKFVKFFKLWSTFVKIWQTYLISTKLQSFGNKQFYKLDHILTILYFWHYFNIFSANYLILLKLSKVDDRFVKIKEFWETCKTCKNVKLWSTNTTRSKSVNMCPCSFPVSMSMICSLRYFPVRILVYVSFAFPCGRKH